MENIVKEINGSIYFDDPENKWLGCEFHITEKGDLCVAVSGDKEETFVLAPKDGTRLRVFLEEYGF